MPVHPHVCGCYLKIPAQGFLALGGFTPTYVGIMMDMRGFGLVCEFRGGVPNLSLNYFRLGDHAPDDAGGRV